ncbi:MAG: outer membrane lipoprotein carrier protein LolA [Bacteroidales bacterium]|nr:outer membrane lipoprotein carrier protein LolA [Bacteroidales bacterium]MBO7529329.1 outer membrane lipoprotein carrier protein LolA [Bacteroidales bacterium]
MKKYFLLIISLLALSINLKAQSAEDVFQSVVDKLKSYDNIEIAFDYNMINTEAGIYETMEGIGYIQGEAYKLKIMGQDIICDGSTMWTYNADAEEVMISEVDKSEGGGSPLAIINSYYENISAKFIENSTSTKKIEAKSLLGDENIDKIIITIDAKTLEIKDLHVYDKNKNEFVYDITKFVTNQNLPVDFFTFKEADYPEAEIIDMR